MLDSRALIQKLNELADHQKQFNRLLELFIANMTNTSQEIKTSLDQVSKWQQVIHELETKQVLDELLSHGFNRVYGFVYANPKEGLRKMILIPSPTFEEASAAGMMKMRAEGLNPGDWLIEGFQFIDVPKDTTLSSSTAQKIEEQFKIKRPIDVYVNDLKLVKDKFCEKESEKKIIDKVINRIEHEHKIKRTAKH
jgi:hypothetical protein